MTETEQLKFLDDKIKANKAQYNLDREAATIFALSTKELDKYEYLTGEYLGYKPNYVQTSKLKINKVQWYIRYAEKYNFS